VYTDNDFYNLYDENAFAEAHHSIIDRFLTKKGLPCDDYYDVVVFGFLRAVRQYNSRPELRKKYCFSTIAWRKMTDDLYKHYRKQSRPMRKASTVSLDDIIYDRERLTRGELIPGRDVMMEDLEAEWFWDEISGFLTEEQIEALQLRADGYTDREIAVRRKRRISDVEDMFASIRAEAACLSLA